MALNGGLVGQSARRVAQARFLKTLRERMKHVALIDVDATTRRILGVGLSTAGHAVVAGATAADLRDAPVAGWSAVVVVLRDRIGVTEDLERFLERHADVPLVVVTAFGTFAAERAAASLRAAAHCRAPLDLYALRAAVDEAIREGTLPQLIDVA